MEEKIEHVRVEIDLLKSGAIKSEEDDQIKDMFYALMKRFEKCVDICNQKTKYGGTGEEESPEMESQS